jgi:hypothetical protein
MRKFNVGDVVSSTSPPYLNNRKIVSIDDSCTPILCFIEGREPIETSPPLSCTENSLVLVEEAHAQPGDTIEITFNEDGWLGKRFVVVESDRKGSEPGEAWFYDEHKTLGYFMSHNYKIISRSGKAPNNKANRDVDTFLKEQKDDNLRSVFG